jgi:oligopeptide transport system substrate-binding protein
VKYSFELLSVNSKDNVNFGATFKDRVQGANKFFEASVDKPTGEIEGIKVVDDYTVRITLTAPSTSFLYALAAPATSIIPKEAVEKYGVNSKVGTGPFIFAAAKGTENVILKRNNHYHGVDSLGNQLPFLDTVIINFFPTKKEELENFKDGNLSIVIGLSSESIKDMVEKDITDFQNKPPKYILDRSAEMATQYYSFNLTKAPFNNVKVRKAFSYAINRNRIIDEVLRGEAFGPGTTSLKSKDTTLMKKKQKNYWLKPDTLMEKVFLQ